MGSLVACVPGPSSWTVISTVLLVTHRPSHMRLADKIFYLEGGRLILAGSPERVLPQMGIG